MMPVTSSSRLLRRGLTVAPEPEVKAPHPGGLVGDLPAGRIEDQSDGLHRVGPAALVTEPEPRFVEAVAQRKRWRSIFSPPIYVGFILGAPNAKLCSCWET